MKKIVTILLSAATLVGVTGCESFLEEESYGSTTDLFNEENGLKAFVNLSYTKINNLYGGDSWWPVMTELGTDTFLRGKNQGDTGLTGRKIIVDTYGGYARHGGGCFSGKDPTKVDRSAAYAARYVAKNLVAAGLARRCELQLAYAIGVAQPVSILVDTQGTGALPDGMLERLVREQFDLRPEAIIEMLGLRRPIYRQTAAYGHFGRTDVDLPWERPDRRDALLAAAGRLG